MRVCRLETMNPVIHNIQQGGIAYHLAPDSRGFVTIQLMIQTDKGFVPISQAGFIPSEYLPDIHNATMATMAWMVENCDNHTTEEGRHLYFGFKEAVWSAGSRLRHALRSLMKK